MLKGTFIFFMLFVFLTSSQFYAAGQEDTMIEDLSASTELPEGAINSMVQDNNGFIWIGTWKGLYRYDGYEVINFSNINDNFSALKIEELMLSGDNLWVGTFVNGLIRINLNTYDIFNYTTSSEEIYKIPDNNIISFCEVSDKKLLVGTERGGFFSINEAFEVEQTYTIESHPNILRNKQVSVIRKIDKQRVLLGNNGLLVFNTETEEATHYDHPDLQLHIADAMVISENEYLVTTYQGLFYVNTLEEFMVESILNFQVKYFLPHYDITERKVLIGTFETILEYDIESRAVTEFVQSGNPLSLNINTLLYTQNNIILIGSESGLYSLLNHKRHFRSIISATNEENPDIISCIEKSDETIFAGTWGKGLYTIDKNNDLLQPTSFLFNGNTPRYIYQVKAVKNTVWLSCKNQLGIFRFDKRYTPYRLNYIQSFDLGNNEQGLFSVTSISELKDKTLILGTWEGYLFYYNESTDTFKAIRDTRGNLPKSQGLSIFSILEDNDGYLWVALNGGGVLKMKLDNNVISEQQIINSDSGLANDFVTTIFQSRNNKIWVGTEAGLSVIDGDEFESVYHKDLIFDIQSITEDPIGFLWIGTQKGLVRINSNHLDEPFKLFDKSDGLSSNSFYLNSLESESDYTFYFGGFNGIDYFTPYKIEYNYKKPVPKITNFTLFNENIYPCNYSDDPILERNIVSTNEIELEYNQNSFALEFSNLEYHLQEKCQFSYFMEGVDMDWNFKDANHRVANYTKLSPGTYKFMLKSTNNDGVWCDEPQVLTISIAPPIWATTWAYIIYFVVAMVGMSILIYNQLLKVQAKHKQQLREVEYRKQKELDELKLRFFTNISHEFRTPLTLILGPLSKILEKDPNNPYKEQHLMIFRNASRLLQLTNRIMDFRKSEKDQLKLKVEKTNISEFIYNIFLFFNYEAQKRSIDYRYKTSYEGNVYLDQEFVESITFNLLSNAFKYTPDGNSIILKVFKDEKGINISIADTGKGMTPEEEKHIFDRYYSSTNRNSAGIGLSFTKRLVELHKADIKVSTEFQKGSTFTLTLPAEDIYSQQEKSTHINKETIVDWKQIDQTIQNNISDELTNLKNIYNKDEMIALIVDDNFEVRQFLVSLLESEFKIIEAANGKEGLELANKHIPDIVISDIMMPEMDGLELTGLLKSDPRTDHIPIILTTVLSSQTDRIKGLKTGADSYIPKPIDPNHLMIRVHKLIEQQLKLKEKFNLTTLSVENEEENSPKEELHPLVEKAHAIVLQNLDNSEYNIDNFCADLGLSRMQLYRKFKAITGLSANSFIRKVRLHKAAELLKTGNYTVKEVTYDVGFIDLKYFRKCFHEEFGVNPSEYAKNGEE